MKDGVPKGTGNSRFLKSAISTATTWEQFRTMLVNGTLPIDLGGVNAAGWQVQGDALNKANLLPDSVATALGLSGNPQVKDALAKITAKTECVIGTYTGNTAESRVINLGFRPKAVLVWTQGKIWDVSENVGFTTQGGNTAGTNKYLYIVSNGFAVARNSMNGGTNGGLTSYVAWR